MRCGALFVFFTICIWRSVRFGVGAYICVGEYLYVLFFPAVRSHPRSIHGVFGFGCSHTKRNHMKVVTCIHISRGRCVVEVIKGMRMSTMSRRHVLNKIVYGVLHACTCETFKFVCVRKRQSRRERENARARALTNDFMRDDKWFGEHSEVTVRTK